MSGYRWGVVQLSDEQKDAVRSWAEDGATLNDIQKRLKDEFDVSMLYMDVRFLVSDLGIELQDAKKKKEAEAEAAAQAEAEAAGEGGEGDAVEAEAEVVGDDVDGGGETLEDLLADDGEGGGSVSVTVDSIAVPGTVVSGTATFSDGKGAKWYLDQMGRLGFDPDEPDYRPSELDVMAFQQELQGVLRQQGF